MTGLNAPYAMFGMVTPIVLAFLASSIDDFALLACLYAARQASTREITAAKMLCATLALCMAMIFAAVCLALPLSISRLMGLLPLALGAKRLLDNRKSRSATSDGETAGAYPRMRGGGTMSRVSCLVAILFAASLDNIALYVPLCVQGGRAVVVPIVGIVLTLTLMLCGLAWLSGTIRIPLRNTRLRLEPAVPYLMMFIGIKALAT